MFLSGSMLLNFKKMAQTGTIEIKYEEKKQYDR
jgi:hypothetical protein